MTDRGTGVVHKAKDEQPVALVHKDTFGCSYPQCNVWDSTKLFELKIPGGPLKEPIWRCEKHMIPPPPHIIPTSDWKKHVEWLAWAREQFEFCATPAMSPAEIATSYLLQSPLQGVCGFCKDKTKWQPTCGVKLCEACFHISSCAAKVAYRQFASMATAFVSNNAVSSTLNKADWLVGFRILDANLASYADNSKLGKSTVAHFLADAALAWAEATSIEPHDSAAPLPTFSASTKDTMVVVFRECSLSPRGVGLLKTMGAGINWRLAPALVLPAARFRGRPQVVALDIDDFEPCFVDGTKKLIVVTLDVDCAH